MKVNVYDFDKTIFDGDSTQKFYLYLLKNHPEIAIYLPKQFIFFILFIFKIMPKTKFKEKFYSCFKILKNIDEDVLNFWEKNISGIKKFYLENRQDSDIIISASPDFLLRPLCEKIGIKHLIASNVNKKTGAYTGLNCYGKEKVLRLNLEIPNTKIKEFYSDSFSDEPLAELAEKSYIVLGDRLFDWWEYKKNNKKA